MASVIEISLFCYPWFVCTNDRILCNRIISEIPIYVFVTMDTFYRYSSYFDTLAMHGSYYCYCCCCCCCCCVVVVLLLLFTYSVARLLFYAGLYFAVGVSINVLFLKKKGLEIIPNFQFWTEVPFLFRVSSYPWFYPAVTSLSLSAGRIYILSQHLLPAGGAPHRHSHRTGGLLRVPRVQQDRIVPSFIRN